MSVRSSVPGSLRAPTVLTFRYLGHCIVIASSPYRLVQALPWSSAVGQQWSKGAAAVPGGQGPTGPALRELARAPRNKPNPPQGTGRRQGYTGRRQGVKLD